MTIEAINHNLRNNYSYAIDKNTIQIRIRCKKKDAKSVFLHALDKYDNKKYNEILKMNYEISDKLYDYFIVEVEPKYNRCAYFFEILDFKNNKIFYSEENFYKDKNLVKNLFEFPYINSFDVFKSPKWLNNSIFYQIFPDRFNNGSVLNDPENVSKWGSKEKENSFYGGDLIGIYKKISYLKNLGIDVIYINPIFNSDTNHRYDTKDYLKIDKILGNKGDLKKLILKCHKNDMKVVLDFALNHTGRNFFAFADILRNKEKSKYLNWYYIHKFPLIEEDKINYETFSFASYMPKLNYENKDVRNYFLKVIKYWIEVYKIDGIRIDVANEIPLNFLRLIRSKIKSINSEVLLLGEIWHNSMPWLMGDIFDSVTNYKFTNNIVDYLVFQNISINDFKNNIGNLIASYPTNVLQVLVNSLNTHDTERILHNCKNIMIYKQTILFLMTFIGVPCIYYGDETGNTKNSRECEDWSNIDKDVFSFYNNLIKFRKSNLTLLKGNFKFIDVKNDNVLVYKRNYENEDIIVIINTSNVKEKISIKEFKENLELNSYEYKIFINYIEKKF